MDVLKREMSSHVVVLNLQKPVELNIFEETEPWVVKRIYINPDLQDTSTIKKGVELLRDAGNDAMYWLSRYSTSTYQRWVGDLAIHFEAIYHHDGTRSLYADVNPKYSVGL